MCRDNAPTRLSFIQQLQQGAEAAWETFVDRYGGLVRGQLWRAGLTGADLDDLVQTVLMRVFQSIQNFAHRGGVGQFRTWLRILTQHLLIDFRQTQARQPALHSPEYLEQLVADLERDLADQWQRDLLEEAKNAVHPDCSAEQWRAFELRRIEGQQTLEVARQLGRKPGWVAVTVHRIEKAIREWLERREG